MRIERHLHFRCYTLLIFFRESKWFQFSNFSVNQRWGKWIRPVFNNCKRLRAFDVLNKNVLDCCVPCSIPDVKFKILRHLSTLFSISEASFVISTAIVLWYSIIDGDNFFLVISLDVLVSCHWYLSRQVTNYDALMPIHCIGINAAVAWQAFSSRLWLLSY